MAGFFAKIIEKLGFESREEEAVDFALGLNEGIESESMDKVLRRSSNHRNDLNVYDYRDRERYVRECCEMMTAASKEVEAQKVEYQTVTERLSDLDEIARLPISARE